MPSKVERLHVIDELATPDLWPDIRKREPGGEPEGPGPLPPARRLLAAIVALGVAAAGTLVVIRAFTGDEPNRPLTAPGAGRIVFSGGGGDAQVDLFSMHPDGSDVRQLTDTPASEEQPAPSPDGSRLAFAVREPGDPTSYVIGVMDADGANRGEISGTRLEPRNPVGDPAWSPEGSEIAFAAYGDGGGIYVAGVDGGRPRRLTSAGPPTIHVDGEPVWSPNGDAIAFIRWIIGGSDEPPAYEILEVSPSGGDATLIARFPAPTQGSPDDNGEVRGLSWSSDGSQLAFATEGAIFTIDADGAQPRELVSCEDLGCDSETDVFTDSTTWSIDGRRIAFTAWVNVPSARADPPLIYVATVSEDPSTVTSTGVGGLFPAWLPVPAEPSSPPPSPESPRVSDVTLPGGLAASRIGIGAGGVWALASTGETGSDALVRIEPETRQALASTPLDPDPRYVAAGAGAVWVGFPRSSVIQQVDATTNEVTGRIALPGDGVSAIAADDEAVWVEVFQDRSDQGQQNLASLVRVDSQTSEVVATIPLEGLSGYDDEIAIGAGAVWVAGVNLTGPSEERGADLLRIDPVANSVSAALPVSAFSVAAGADAVWVTAPADGVNDSLHKPETWVAREIDPTTNGVSAPISLPGNVSAVLAVTADGVWFSGYDVDGLIHPVRFQDGAFDPSVPPIDSIYTDIAFDEGTGAIWIAATDGLKRVDIG
jgi:Tol biopolymer transport system component